MTQKKRPPAKAAKAEDVKERTVPIKIYFSPGLAARLTEAVALRKREDRGANMSALVAEALEAYLPRLR